MPVYLYWGEDDFAIAVAVKELQQRVLDPNWMQFNYHKLPGDRSETILEGINQAITPPFGMGGRLIWLSNTNVCQQCPADLLTEWEVTLPTLLETSHLLLTTSKKPDNRLKSTKLIRKYAREQEFSLIAPWKIETIQAKVRQTAQAKGVMLTAAAVELLADSVGNNTRRLWNELEKLSIYGNGENSPLDADIVSTLVVCNTQNSIQLAAAIREGNLAKALGLVSDLINRNEPPLRIVATLVGQFRTWTIVKLMLEAGEKDDKAIAAAAEVTNPKRMYFIRQEIAALNSPQLLATLPLLLELEFSLKKGSEPKSTLQTKIIELCRVLNN